MSNYISRKSIYLGFLILNVIISLLRYLFQPDLSIGFHLTSFAGAYALYILGWEILLLMNKIFEKPFPIATRPVPRVGIQIILMGIVFFFFSIILYQITAHFFEFRMIGAELYSEALFSGFIYSLIFNLLMFGRHYFQQWKNDLVIRAQLEKEQAVVKYDILRNQLNPHFLFNALTSLNSLIFENQKLASDFLQQLSKVYRYILQNKEKDTVALSTEISFIRHYISLLKMRFGEAIQININIDDDDLDKGVVPVLFQTLIENAVKHNIVSLEAPLVISITTAGNYLVIRNSKNRKEQVETSNKVGLANLKALYQYLSIKPVLIEDSVHDYVIRIPLIDEL